VVLHEFGENDAISLSPDRQTAVCMMHCGVELETAIGPICLLVEMARAQGGGFVRRSESGVFEQSYIKREGCGRFSARRLAPHKHQGLTRTLHGKVQPTSRAIAALLAVW
jgi:hypothetical protein